MGKFLVLLDFLLVTATQVSSLDLSALSALAVLLMLLYDTRSAIVVTEMPLRSSSLLRRARNMKAHIDFKNPAIVQEHCTGDFWAFFGSGKHNAEVLHF